MSFVEATAPGIDVLEVSLFGTGIGECLAIHFGAGEWMLVDSCCNAKSAEPVSLAYLKALGVNVSTDVKLIVATHWHDDHVDGLGQLVSQCCQARLAFSSALERDEFQKLIGLFLDPDITFDREKSGVREIGDCFRALMTRKENGDDTYAPILTHADHRIYRRDDCEVVALSPSDHSILKAYTEVSKMWGELEVEAHGVGGPKPSRAGVPSPERNHNAVALWVKWDDRRILLGADLEEEGQPNIGWQAVLSCNQFPDGEARVFKIPHHGSPNGHHEPIWDELLEKAPYAVVTAYNRGVTPRPSITDLERIKRRADATYFTSLPAKTQNQYSKTVERTLKEGVRRRTSLKPNMGHIQIRWYPDGNVQVETAGAAGRYDK